MNIYETDEVIAVKKKKIIFFIIMAKVQFLSKSQTI